METSAQPPGYQDRLIEDGALPPDVTTGTAREQDGSGWPRMFRVQAISSRTRGAPGWDETRRQAHHRQYHHDACKPQ